GAAHAIADHLRLFDDLLDGELADDAAEMAFHHQTDKTLALLRALGEELFCGGADGDGVGLYFDLCDGFDGDGDALLRIEILLWRDVKRHQLEVRFAASLNHGKDDCAAVSDDAVATEAVDDEGFVRTHFAIHAGKRGHDQEHDQDSQSGKHPSTTEIEHMSS